MLTLSICLLPPIMQYGALMIVDSEDEFYPEEITKLEHDVRHLGLGEWNRCWSTSTWGLAGCSLSLGKGLLLVAFGTSSLANSLPSLQLRAARPLIIRRPAGVWRVVR